MSLAAVPGQIALGHLSDRIGRELVWTIGNLGFAVTYIALLLLARDPRVAHCCMLMIGAQGLLRLRFDLGALGRSRRKFSTAGTMERSSAR